MTSRGINEAPPGMWRPTDFTDTEDREFHLYRQCLFENVIKNSGEEVVWSTDWAGARLHCDIHGDEFDRNRDPLTLRIYFTPCMTLLFVQMNEFQIRPKFKYVPDVVKFIRQRDRSEECRVHVTEQGNIFMARVFVCLDVNFERTITPLILGTLEACNAVTHEALFLRDYCGVVRK